MGNSKQFFEAKMSSANTLEGLVHFEDTVDLGNRTLVELSCDSDYMFCTVENS